MKLTAISLSEREIWDRTVRSFSSYDVYYLSGYVTGFSLHGDGEPLLLVYESETLRGMNVVMKRDVASDPHLAGKIPENEWYDLVTPYGYGGWLLEGTGDREPLFEAYAAWCAKQKIISEFVRFHPVLHNHVFAEDYYEVIPLGGTIAMDLSTPETIWENMTSKNRNMIRKAMKNGVHVFQARNPKIFQVFRDIYNQTMDKDHAAAYYYFDQTFYNSLLEDLSQQAQVFYAQMEDGQIVAASIMLAANGRMSYHLSGSLRAYQHLAPTNLILYEAARWGCANGCRTLHLGGGVGSGEDSLYAFKKAFYRGEPCRFHIGKKIFDENVYRHLVEVRDVPPQGSFFPQYRA